MGIVLKMKRFISGVKTGLPICMGVIPVGISFGIIARQGGLESWQAILMSIIVIAGASQIMAVGMLVQGASIPAIIFATFLINLRHLIMSTYVMNRLKEKGLLKKMALAYVLVDETFALFSMSEESEDDDKFMFGINVVLGVSWIVSTMIGCIALSVLPETISKSLGIAFYASFIAILMPNIRKNMQLFLVVLITGIINSIFGMFFSSSTALILSILTGAGIGMFIIKDQERGV